MIDPVGNAPILLAMTEAQDRIRKLRTALEGTAIAAAIMLFFALCEAYILAYLNITEAAFKIAGGIILFLVALDMLGAKRQQRKSAESTGGDNTSYGAPDDSDSDNITIYPLASTLTGYAALMAVMVATGIIPCLTVVAEGWLNEKITMVLSRITAIILADLPVQYVMDGLATIGIVDP